MLIAFITLSQIGILGGEAVAVSLPAGLLYFAACLPMAFVGLWSAKRQARAAVAGIALVAKQPDQMSKALIFAAMVETYAILALLISILVVPYEKSLCRVMTSGETGFENAGQPQPESNLSSEENRTSPSTTSTYIPSSKKSSYSPLNGGSVMASCVISNSFLLKWLNSSLSIEFKST